jgi:hypothetical protein
VDSEGAVAVARSRRVQNHPVGRRSEMVSRANQRAGPADTHYDQVRVLFTGKRPAPERSADRTLYDNLLAPESPLFQRVDLSRLIPERPKIAKYGLPLTAA